MVYGFDAAGGDKIKISSAIYSTFEEIMNHTAQLGTDTVIFDGTDWIDLVYVDLTTLTSGNFEFV